MNQVLISTSMDLLMDDELAEETLLMEKATLLLQEIEEDKMMSPSKSTSKSNKSSPSVENEKDVKKKKSKSKSKTKKTKKVKKSVRFASDDKLTCVEYLTPRSTRAVDRLFYSDDDMQWMLHQLQCDVTAYEQHGAKESATFSCRGLERRTACGSAQRARWRKTCRTVVLDEQDRQWLVLPMDEPVDEQRIAFVSLEVTHKAKQLARKRAIQDERDIRKDLQQQQTKDASSRTQTTTGMDVSWQTDGTGRSSMGCSHSCSSVEEECCGCSKQHHHLQKKHNRKGHSVHFPAASRQMFEVHEYQHVANDEESKALWHPYLSLNDAKLQYASQIAILEQQQQQQQQGTQLHAAASSSSSTESSTQAQDEESTRGLEARTTQAETTYEQLRTEFSKTLRLQALDPAVFSKQCQKLSAKSRKQARTRALMDQRAVKVLQQSSVSNNKSTTKKLVTRVPKVRTASPPKDGGSGQSNKSPTRRSDSPKPLDWKDDSFHGSSHSHGTVKRAPVVIATTAAQEETAEEPSKPRGVVHRVGDWSSVGTLDTMDSTLLSSSSSSTLTMPSGSLSSISQAPDDDMMEDVDTAEGEELDQVCRSSKPTRRSLPDLSATLMMTTTTVVEQPRRHSSAMYRLSKVTEEDYCSDDEEEVDSGIPKAVLVGIPDKYFGRNSKSAAYKPSAADLEALQESIAGTPLAQCHDDGGDDQGLMDDKSAGGDGSGRLSGIIERLWDKRRGGKGSELVHNQTMMDAAI
ncbi:expressed unknown protein [Seminavis robusta]|uniref:Uncharacterized protein n=1 Tax=Seminavis robusta TaxID=568900 RepID=A0A9N8I086_9STRA|nr:expressed unknown protein [Seminavis robusta]|eukprot:Sro3541_g349080.1 n/a (746) ;mRNA; r:1226-3463